MSNSNIQPQISSQAGRRTSNDSLATRDNHAVSKRLQKELMSLMVSGEKSISAFPDGDNIFKWIGTITGPINSVYNEHKYRLSLEFPKDYPYEPPAVAFLTPCFHPNVDMNGAICLDILGEKWSALYDVRTILISVQSLLAQPNVESPLNEEAAILWCDQEAYKTYLNGFCRQHSLSISI